MSKAAELTLKNIFLALITSITVGAIAGVGGILLGEYGAPSMGISSFEGGHGYFGALCGLVCGAIGFILASIFTLRKGGVRGVGVLLGFLTVLGCFMMIVATCGAIYFSSQPKLLNEKGVPPRLRFEILAPSTDAFASRDVLRVELNTDQNVAEATLDPAIGADALGGSVPLEYQTSSRLIVLHLPNKEIRIFKLKLPGDPLGSSFTQWGEWQRADFIDHSDQSQLQPVTADPDFKIRVKMEIPS